MHRDMVTAFLGTCMQVTGELCNVMATAGNQNFRAVKELHTTPRAD